MQKNLFDKRIVAHPVTLSQFSCYKQAVMSKIRELINKTNACVELIHTKTYGDFDPRANVFGRKLIHTCDEQENNQRINCASTYRNENTKERENYVLICNKLMHKNAASEVIKYLDCKRHGLEYVQDKRGEHWKKVDTDAHNIIYRAANIKLKCTRRNAVAHEPEKLEKLIANKINNLKVK